MDRLDRVNTHLRKILYMNSHKQIYTNWLRSCPTCPTPQDAGRARQ